ncbi:MAG: polysaccharide biosynthesis C-terminal domain-containing protein [Bacteroidales bacterium]|nr:polysaccharide biosynthesis C-terminal domain-containing protein [Bacteroidales bacterium]
MNLKKHITNVRALQFFQIFRFGVLLLISIVFTKSDLGIGQIGVYETFLLIAGAVSFFWIGGMLQSLLGIFENNETFGNEKNSPLLFNTFVLFTFFSVLAAIIVYLLQPLIADLFSISGGEIPYMKILFMYIVVSDPVNLIEYIYLLKNKSLSIILYGTITFTLQLFAVTLPILLGFDLGYGLYGLVFINIIRFVWLIIIILKYSRIQFSFGYIKEYMILSIPLIMSILISGSAQYVDGFIISYKFDEATFAVFRYGARELPFIVLLLYAFGNAMTSKFSDTNNLNQASKELKDGTKRLMHYLYPASILIILLSKYLYPIVFSPQFADSAIIFNIYLLIIVTRFVFSRVILIGLKKTKVLFYSSLVEIVINVALSLIFIQFWGIVGVAYATVISYIFEKAILVLVLSKKHKIKLSNYLDINIYLMYSTLLIVAFVISLFL